MMSLLSVRQCIKMQHPGAKGDCRDYSELVPLYGKETHKADLLDRYKVKSTAKLNSGESFVSSLGVKKSNSYLDQFRAKKTPPILKNSDGEDTNCSCESDYSYHCDDLFYNAEEASVYNMKSVSEYSLQLNSSIKKKISFKAAVINVPVKLGGLGPDPELCKEKMKKLRRQQSYGQKVSNYNRMKIIERQVVKNLDKELKKSSQVDKYVENVLIKSKDT